MIVFQTRVGIERPIEEVFAYVSDPGNFPVLERGRPGRTPDVRGSEQRRLDLRDQRQLPSGAATNQLEIAKGEQPHEFAIGTTAGPTPFLYRYTFGPAWVWPQGQSQQSTSVCMGPPRLFGSPALELPQPNRSLPWHSGMKSTRSSDAR
jgi:hypothetical protein